MNLISTYLKLYEETETPLIYTRWALHVGIGALLKHNLYLPFSSTKIFPNLYVMLMGDPGVRKSTAIYPIRSHLLNSGFSNFSMGKGHNDDFIERLAGESTEDHELNLFGIESENQSDIFVCAEEATDFFGHQNHPLLGTLTSLWDHVGKYLASTRRYKKLTITDPCISILCANTPVSLSESFPVQILGQGLLSRFILVYSERRLDRFAFPEPPSKSDVDTVNELLSAIANNYHNKAIKMEPAAKKLLEKIYYTSYKVDDIRFSGYNNRRFAHLLKLCITTAASKLEDSITDETVAYSNTVLWHTEQVMPKALGEFGRSKSSELNQAVLQFVYTADKAVSAQEILAGCKGAISSVEDVIKVCRLFIETGQFQSDRAGFLPKRNQISYPAGSEFDPSVLTSQERMMTI